MFQSLFVLDRKLMYVFSGGEDVPDFLECGELTSLVRPWCDVDDGGVRGCDEDPETFLLNVSIGARALYSLARGDNIQGIKLQHIGMRVRSSDDEVRVAA